MNLRELVGGDDLGWALAIPCIGDSAIRRKSGRAIVPCDRRETPTRVVAEKQVDDARAHIADVLAALERGEEPDGVIVCGRGTQLGGEECPKSVDGKCSVCGSLVDPIYMCVYTLRDKSTGQEYVALYSTSNGDVAITPVPPTQPEKEKR